MAVPKITLRPSRGEIITLYALYSIFNKAMEIMPRRKARLLAVQFLYQLDIDFDRNLEAALADFWSQQKEKLTDSIIEFANSLARGVYAHWAELNASIAAHSQNWIFERISPVDRCILRIAIYEILYRHDIPPVVSINEAIEIAKILSTDDAPKYINGILDRIMRDTLRASRTASPIK